MNQAHFLGKNLKEKGIKEKDLYLGPLEFFEDEGFDARAPARAEISDLDFWSRP